MFIALLIKQEVVPLDHVTYNGSDLAQSNFKIIT